MELQPGAARWQRHTFRLDQAFPGGIRSETTDSNNPVGSAKAQTDIAVMWDRIGVSGRSKDGFVHIPSGINMLYMDGHVEFSKYPADSGKIGNERTAIVDRVI